MEQPMQAPAQEQQQVSPEQEQVNPEQQQANPEQQDAKQVHERFIINVMKMASGDQHDKMIGMAKSSKDAPQGLARAIYFIVSSVRKGLEDKDIQIPPQLWLAKNGILEQSTKLITMLADKAGVQITKDDIPEVMELVAEQLAGDADMAQQQGQPEAQEGQPQEQAPQEAPQEPPQEGLLTQAGAV